MSRPSIHYACKTDAGKTRVLNEDAYIDCPDIGLWVVADGMGGYEGGEIASNIAVNHIPAMVTQGASLTESLHSAHEAVLYAGQSGIGKKGMGTTVVALKIEGNRYQIAWVGDSRAYLWDKKKFVQLSHDHSVVQELVDHGIISKQEAFRHPDRNIITQALGSPQLDNLRIDTVSGRLKKGQTILLCTDGLTTEVQEEQINHLLGSSKSEQEKTTMLIDAALAGGGNDNITAVTVSSVAGTSWLAKIPLLGLLFS